MSTYRRDKTQIRDEALFKEAATEICKEQGLTLEHDPEGQISLLYRGGKAHYRIPARELGGFDDLAYVKQPDGSFDILKSAHRGYGKQEQVARDIMTRYSTKFIEQKVAAHPVLRRFRKRVTRNDRQQVVRIRLEG